MSNGTQPTLQELFGRFLNKQTTAHATGLATFDPSGEVTPYEAGPVLPIDPSAAWTEATAVVLHFSPQTGIESISAPPNWPTLVNAQEPAVAVAFCVGNYPQLVRNLYLVMSQDDSEALRPANGRAVESEELDKWIEQVCDGENMPDLLFAVGALRLSKQMEKATELMDRCDDAIPDQWRSAWHNERAALAWHNGDAEKALSIWESQEDSTAVLFNRGMASLFLGKKEAARKALSAAVEAMDEGSWRHLAQLYLAKAQAN